MLMRVVGVGAAVFAAALALAIEFVQHNALALAVALNWSAEMTTPLDTWLLWAGRESGLQAAVIACVGEVDFAPACLSCSVFWPSAEFSIAGDRSRASALASRAAGRARAADVPVDHGAMTFQERVLQNEGLFLLLTVLLALVLPRRAACSRRRWVSSNCQSAAGS